MPCQAEWPDDSTGQSNPWTSLSRSLGPDATLGPLLAGQQAWVYTVLDDCSETGCHSQAAAIEPFHTIKHRDHGACGVRLPN